MSSRLASTFVGSNGNGNGGGHQKTQKTKNSFVRRTQIDRNTSTNKDFNTNINKRKGKHDDQKEEDYQQQSVIEKDTIDMESFEDIEYLYRSTIANIMVSNQKLATFHEAELECYRGLYQDSMAKQFNIKDIATLHSNTLENKMNNNDTNTNENANRNEEKIVIRRKSVGPGLSNFVTEDSKENQENNLT